MATMDVLKLDSGETLTVPVAAEPASAVLWCSEDDVTWTLEYVAPLGSFLDDASVTWAAGTLTVTTSDELWIGHLFAFDRELTVAELAAIMARLGSGETISYETILPYATDENFGGYLYLREDLDTGEIVHLGTNLSRSATTWLDDTALGGHAYRYRAQYAVVQDLDVVNAEPATDEASVTILGVVMAVVGGGEGRAALRYFADPPEIAPQRDRVVRKNWSAKPRIGAGPQDAKRWRATARVFQERGAGWTPEDLIAAIDALGQAVPGPDNRLVPKVVCVRDDLGTMGWYSVLGVSWLRNNRGHIHEVELDLMEVAWPGGVA